jgi:hypothetical protein
MQVARQLVARGVATMATSSDPAREFLRHTVATVAYRGGKALRGAPREFSRFQVAEGSRTPGQILAHICDLFDWAISIAQCKEAWNSMPPREWNEDVERFFASLAAFDKYLASSAPLGAPPEMLFQAPIADALTHIGQIAMLRRIAGSPVRAENYSRADIVAGRVGAEQTSAKHEFD